MAERYSRLRGLLRIVQLDDIYIVMFITETQLRNIIREIIELDSAQVLSQWAHQGQKRRSGEPYFLHPQEVANIVRRYYQDIPTYYAAMLHDALEDGIPLGNISDEEEFFNMLAAEVPASAIDDIDSIYDAVVALTKPKYSNYGEYVTRLTGNPIAFRVKLADMMQNISDAPSERQLVKYVKTKNMLVDRFKNEPPPGISSQHWKDFTNEIEKAAEKSV